MQFFIFNKYLISIKLIFIFLFQSILPMVFLKKKTDAHENYNFEKIIEKPLKFINLKELFCKELIDYEIIKECLPIPKNKTFLRDMFFENLIIFGILNKDHPNYKKIFTKTNYLLDKHFVFKSEKIVRYLNGIEFLFYKKNCLEKIKTTFKNLFSKEKTSSFDEFYDMVILFINYYKSFDLFFHQAGNCLCILEKINNIEEAAPSNFLSTRIEFEGIFKNNIDEYDDYYNIVTFSPNSNFPNSNQYKDLILKIIFFTMGGFIAQEIFSEHTIKTAEDFFIFLFHDQKKIYFSNKDIQRIKNNNLNLIEMSNSDRNEIYKAFLKLLTLEEVITNDSLVNIKNLFYEIYKDVRNFLQKKINLKKMNSIAIELFLNQGASAEKIESIIKKEDEKLIK